MAAKRGFGQVQRLPSKRYRARYTGPDTALHNAPHTFDARGDAEAWLTDERRLIAAGTWTPPARRSDAARSLNFGDYAEKWIAARALKPRTVEHYRKLLDRFILPAFGDHAMQEISAEDVRAWHSRLGDSTPTLRAHAYSLLRTILGDAARDGMITTNPCHIRGASSARRVHLIRPASLPELETIAASMPPEYRMMVLLAAWCAMRLGELSELRRFDVDLTNGVIHVRRAVVRTKGELIIGTPKSAAGVRDVNVPPHLLDALREHVAIYAAPGRDGLLFPSVSGGNLPAVTLRKHYHRARAAAGRPDLRFHDLRHTGAVLAASTGATLAELMARLGHSTPGAAMRYQHAMQGRDKIIARKLSELLGEPK
jgi:integrase